MDEPMDTVQLWSSPQPFVLILLLSSMALAHVFIHLAFGLRSAIEMHDINVIMALCDLHRSRRGCSNVSHCERALWVC